MASIETHSLSSASERDMEFSNNLMEYTKEAIYVSDLKGLTRNIGSSMNFTAKTESTLEFCNLIYEIQEETNIYGNISKEYLRNSVRHCKRSDQAHVVDPSWCDVPLKIKTDIYSALKNVENEVKEDEDKFKEFRYFQGNHFNAWKGKDVQPILSGNPGFRFTDYFDIECPEVCLPRLSVLVAARLDMMAFNLADFLVKNLLEKMKRKNNFFHVKWLDAASSQITSDTFDVNLILIFKLKKDDILLYPTLTLLSIDDVLSATGCSLVSKKTEPYQLNRHRHNYMSMSIK